MFYLFNFYAEYGTSFHSILQWQTNTVSANRLVSTFFNWSCNRLSSVVKNWFYKDRCLCTCTMRYCMCMVWTTINERPSFLASRGDFLTRVMLNEGSNEACYVKQVGVQYRGAWSSGELPLALQQMGWEMGTLLHSCSPGSRETRSACSLEL